MSSEDKHVLEMAEVGKAEVPTKKVKAKGEKDEEKSTDPSGSVGLLQLWRFADHLDYWLMLAGSIAAIGHGACLPLMIIFFGDLINAWFLYGTISDSEFNHQIITGVWKLCVIGGSVVVGAYLQMAMWMLAGERQARKIRESYFAALLRQDIGWFDSVSTGSLTARMTGDTTLIQDGISDKTGQIVQNLATFVGGFIVAFTKGPALAGVLCSSLPVLAACALFMASFISGKANAGQDAYADAGALAEAVFSSIRTVVAFGGEHEEIKRYNAFLEKARFAGYKRSAGLALGFGSFMFVIYSTYALGYWYGSILVARNSLDVGGVLTTFFSILIGAFSLGNTGPSIAAIGTAKGAAYKLWRTIERQSKVDSSSTEGLRLEKVRGLVVLDNVSFRYPSREDVPVLEKFSLTIQPNSTVALVGSSGSGKSTIIKLLTRFYDPVENFVSLDGVDTRKMNVKWLRSQIGIVSQEPVLFNCTIRENILYGLKNEMSKYSDEELNAKVEKACRDANIWSFINNLPNKLDTEVGQGGGQLSGGQKQRIAIARAIISEPPILLLDEATSALDTQSERLVQAALDAASKGRTTIVVAHRLSTIRNADNIVVMSKGKLIEMGKHEELIAKNGLYAELVRAQSLKMTKGAENVQSTDSTAEATIKGSPNSSGTPEEVEEAAVGPTAAEVAVTASPLTMSNAVKPQFDSAEDSTTSTKSPGDSLHSSSMSNSMTELQKSGKGAKMQALLEKELDIKAQQKKLLSRPFPYRRVYDLAKKRWKMFAIGSIFSALSGAIMPVFVIFFSEVLSVLSNPNISQMRHDANFWAGMFFMLAGISFVSTVCHILFFGIGGEQLSMEMRQLLFRNIIFQNIGYFDMPENNVGIITNNLSNDALEVRNVTSNLMSQIVQLMSNFVASVIVAIVYDWRLGLVCISTIPLVAAAGFLQFKALSGFNQKTKDAYDKTARIANEAIENIRTVVPLNLEMLFWEEYRHGNEHPHSIAVRGAFISSLSFAFGQSMVFFVYALALWYGGERIKNGAHAKSLLVAMFSVIFMAMSVGQISSFSPNLSKAKIAVLSIFDTLDRQSQIDASKPDGLIADEVHKKHPEKLGQCEVRDGEFKYPNRPDIPIFQGMSVLAEPGQTVALVGPSGCGKSTIIQALERFYDMHKGAVYVEGEDVRKWRLQQLRRQMSLVGQEPVLFDMTIAENICYGVTKEEITQEKMEAVARMSNIHDFVMSLPLGYQTKVGERGGQLSGGQKQRVAIARALMRSPYILLLDEATSALDSDSEVVVQDALDKASAGRTTIVIAHRLSTIQNADKIYVIQAGKVIDCGKHFDLIEKKGFYYELVMQQSLGPESAGGPIVGTGYQSTT